HNLHLTTMHLKEIETRPPEGMMKIAFAKMDESGRSVPEIMHLFRFKKRCTDHLVRFTDEVMRPIAPISWSAGIDMLICLFAKSVLFLQLCARTGSGAAPRKGTGR